MSIETIVLKDMEIVEVEGEFKQIFKNEKRVPCFLTNYALKRGKDLGILSGSLVADLFKLQGLEGLVTNGSVDGDALNSLDEVAMQKTIYLACLGANKNLGMDFDSFLEKYHYSFAETVEIYMNLVKGVISKDHNQFAKGLQQCTKKGKKK
ncbi:hypothetical protein [Peribacillus tepidiphilus]|uniref:hypothetical protein n=1 Tax=Peribacillus tepidiphilus TaxID=2652445 RepID=UPI001290E12C|nr:hypothetical protein [Peribacillus tepidiphilus]